MQDVFDFWKNNDFDLHLPNIGGKTPPEIALSLISEITAVRNKSEIVHTASKSKVLM